MKKKKLEKATKRNKVEKAKAGGPEKEVTASSARPGPFPAERPAAKENSRGNPKVHLSKERQAGDNADSAKKTQQTQGTKDSPKKRDQSSQASYRISKRHHQGTDNRCFLLLTSKNCLQFFFSS